MHKAIREHPEERVWKNYVRGLEDSISGFPR